MTNATMREFKLLMINRKGVEFTPEDREIIKAEDAYFKDLGFEDEVSKDTRVHQFNQNKRGIVYDYLSMAVAILEGPKPDARGVSRKEAATLDSLIDKLWAAQDQAEEGNRPESVMLDEHEWTQLKERVLAHPFPNRGRATTRFQKDIDNVPKVAVGKVGDETL